MYICAVCVFWKLIPCWSSNFANIFSHSVGCLVILFMVSFIMQTLLSLIRYHLFIFVFISITLGDGFPPPHPRQKKVLLQFMSKSALLLFSSRWSHSFGGLRIWKELTWVVAVQGLSRGCTQGVIYDYSDLLTRRERDRPPSSFPWPLEEHRRPPPGSHGLLLPLTTWKLAATRGKDPRPLPKGKRAHTVFL